MRWVVLVSVGLLLPAAAYAQADGANSAGGDAAVRVQSIWDFVVKGGPLMVPIGLCSLIALAIIIERFVTLRRSNVIPSRFVEEIREKLSQGDEDTEEALSWCRRSGSAIAHIFAAGIRKLGDSVEVVEKRIREAGEREIFKLRKYLRGLSVIAAIAPLMGLLGTIFGMIDAFQTVATSSEALGKAEMLAGGIYEAMITTAAGLLLAIPVLIAYHYFSAKIDRMVGEMDQLAIEFVEEFAASHPNVAGSPDGLWRSADHESTETVAAETA